jgi:hypothetical protein
MKSNTLATVYNARIACMFIFLSRILRALFFLLVVFGLIVFVCATPTWAGDWQHPEKQLATKIAAVTGPGTLAFDLVNRSSLSPTDVEQIHRGIVTELQASGVNCVTPEQATATVTIYLSEDPENYVWAGEIHQGGTERSVVMISFPRPATMEGEREQFPVTIHKTLLWSQESRILDVFLLSGNPQRMFVLDPESATLYRSQAGQWQPEQSLAISHAKPWPRDLRGRLVPRKDKDHLFDAYLPGVICRAVTKPALGVSCFASDDPWPLGTDQISLSAFFAPARNFFTGALSPGIAKQTAGPAFYSAAALPREKYTLWMFAAIDGRIHLLDGLNDQITASQGWGSDIASVRSGCGPGWQVLATEAGEGAGDAVQAFNMPDREPVSASLRLEFPGAITALRTAWDNASVIAVSQNSQTRRHEAYQLSLSCNQ